MTTDVGLSSAVVLVVAASLLLYFEDGFDVTKTGGEKLNVSSVIVDCPLCRDQVPDVMVESSNVDDCVGAYARPT